MGPPLEILRLNVRWLVWRMSPRVPRLMEWLFRLNPQFNIDVFNVAVSNHTGNVFYNSGWVSGWNVRMSDTNLGRVRWSQWRNPADRQSVCPCCPAVSLPPVPVLRQHPGQHLRPQDRHRGPRRRHPGRPAGSVQTSGDVGGVVQGIPVCRHQNIPTGGENTRPARLREGAEGDLEKEKFLLLCAINRILSFS